MKTPKVTKEIFILKRAEIKKASTAYNVSPGDLVFIVRGEKNSTHVTTLRNNGHNSCTCTGNASFGRHCYHIKGCEKATTIRIEAAKVVEIPESVESLKEKEWTAYRSELAKKLAKQYVTTQIVEQLAEQLVAPKASKVAKIIEQAVQASVPAIDLSKVGDLGGTRKYSLMR